LTRPEEVLSSAGRGVSEIIDPVSQTIEIRSVIQPQKLRRPSTWHEWCLAQRLQLIPVPQMNPIGQSISMQKSQA
jgi:hypothetical protein